MSTYASADIRSLHPTLHILYGLKLNKSINKKKKNSKISLIFEMLYGRDGFHKLLIMALQNLQFLINKNKS